MVVEQAAQVVSTPISAATPGRTRFEYGNETAFAALRSDGTVVTWGSPARGGDGGGVDLDRPSDNLTVTQIYSSSDAFAALRSDGSVVSWGVSYLGGDSSGVDFDGPANNLVATQIFSSQGAFAALRSDGSVVTWGNSFFGGDSSSVDFDGPDNNLKTIQIFSTFAAFAALRSDGSVVTWGSSVDGGDASDVDFNGQKNNLKVTQIFSSLQSFAALRSNGSVVTWGSQPYGGNSDGVDFNGPNNNRRVQQIFSTHESFAALCNDGSVVTWGASYSGGDSSSVDFDGAANGLWTSQIFSTDHAFAALRSDGSVVTWGESSSGGYSESIDFDGPANNLTVVQIFSTQLAFAALRSDGSVVTWGESSAGGYNGDVDFDGPANDLKVVEVFSSQRAFAALRSDGSVITWGDANFGGNSQGVDFDGPANQLKVDQIFSNQHAFAALRSDGSVITWGDSIYGGNSDSIDFNGPANDLTVVAFANPFDDDRLVFEPLLPTITLAMSRAIVTEDGKTNLVYTFTRTGVTTSTLNVNYTVGGTATLGTDYTGIPTKRATKTISFAAGASTATVTVNPTADSTTEEDETVTLTLASGTGYTIGTTTAVSGSISNDDYRLPLYTATTATLPHQQGWLSFGSGLTGTQTLSSGGTTLTSTALMADMAGYSNHTVAAAQPVNSAFPALDRQTGVSLDFRVRLINENHQDSTRAGFSVTLLDQSATPLGIELGFWTNSIFSQNGGSTPFQTPLERVDGLNTTTATDYSLRLIDQTYFLLANNRLVLSGAVQDYSQWHKNPLLPYNPYTTPNFLFLGDNTSRASASVELGTTTLALATRLSEGNDSLTATSAAETLNGLGGNDRLNGEDGNDWLIGGVGIDQLNGGKGDDVLFGGADVDRFQFSTSVTFHTADLGVDTIVDFNPLQDRLRLSRTTFSALPAGSTLAAAAFEVVSLDDAAASSAALIVYNSLNGRLFYNPNGSDAGFASSISAGGQFAQLWSGASGGPFPALANTMIGVF
ncbi:MAG: hypothetical protein ACK59A_15190 [Cyanobacteriota bacterium]